MVTRRRKAGSGGGRASCAKRTRPATITGRRRFLEAYAETGNVKASCELAKVSRTAHYRWLDDPAYATAFEAAGLEAVDVLEREARRRAVQGVEEPVFYRESVVGTVRKYSDVLLIFLLKGAKPATYRERFEQVAPAAPPVSTLSDAELDAALVKYAALAAGKVTP